MVARTFRLLLQTLPRGRGTAASPFLYLRRNWVSCTARTLSPTSTDWCWIGSGWAPPFRSRWRRWRFWADIDNWCTLDNQQACKLKFRLRELISCLCCVQTNHAANIADSWGIGGTWTGSEFSQPKFELTGLTNKHFMRKNGTLKYVKGRCLPLRRFVEGTIFRWWRYPTASAISLAILTTLVIGKRSLRTWRWVWSVSPFEGMEDQNCCLWNVGFSFFVAKSCDRKISSRLSVNHFNWNFGWLYT